MGAYLNGEVNGLTFVLAFAAAAGFAGLLWLVTALLEWVRGGEDR